MSCCHKRLACRLCLSASHILHTAYILRAGHILHANMSSYPRVAIYCYIPYTPACLLYPCAAHIQDVTHILRTARILHTACPICRSFSTRPRNTRLLRAARILYFHPQLDSCTPVPHMSCVTIMPISLHTSSRRMSCVPHISYTPNMPHRPRDANSCCHTHLLCRPCVWSVCGTYSTHCTYAAHILHVAHILHTQHLLYTPHAAHVWYTARIPDAVCIIHAPTLFVSCVMVTPISPYMLAPHMSSTRP